MYYLLEKMIYFDFFFVAQVRYLIRKFLLQKEEVQSQNVFYRSPLLSSFLQSLFKTQSSKLNFRENGHKYCLNFTC